MCRYIYIYTVHPTIWNTKLDPHPYKLHVCVLFSQSQKRWTPHSTRMGLDELGQLSSIEGEDRSFVLGIT